MEELLKMARKTADQAEIYSLRQNNNTIQINGDKLDNIDSKILAGVCLRLIKNGNLGFAYTRNLTNRQELLDNALSSTKCGVRADYDFPFTDNIPQPFGIDESTEGLSNSELVGECQRVTSLLRPHFDADIIAGAFTTLNEFRIMNSSGSDLMQQSSSYGFYANMSFPGSKAGILRVFKSKRFEPFPDDIVAEMLRLYGHSGRTVSPSSGKMQVLFMPTSMIVFVWRLASGVNPGSIYDKVSPLSDKFGKKVFDSQISIFDDPTDSDYPGARAFDDEAVACRPLTLIDEGEFKNTYYDLNFAGRVNTVSSGHGYKTEPIFQSRDPLTITPIPALRHMFIKPGANSLWEMVKAIDKGIILNSAQSCHTGNIPNGDYSIGVSSGFYVEKGEIIGRVRDGMIAGNIYEALNHVMALGNKLYPCYNAWAPPVLFDNINVTFRQ
jgi:PmbA protein